MTDFENSLAGPLDRFIRAFYDARLEAARAGDLSLLEGFIASDVRWSEPEVGEHMGILRGRDAVIDMIRRALDATGGSFELAVAGTVESATHVSALIDWSAVSGDGRIEGREMAVTRSATASLRRPGSIRKISATTGRSGEKAGGP